MNIHLTEEGYLYKFKGDQKPNMKPGDRVKKIFNTTNNSEIIIFLDDNTCRKIKLNMVQETRVTELGHFIPNLLNENSINIINYSVLDDSHKFLIAVYKNNRVNKINLKSFSGNRRILKNAYNKNQNLLDLITLKEDSKLKIITEKTSVEVDTEKLRETNSRAATGVYVTRKGEAKQVELI